MVILEKQKLMPTLSKPDVNRFWSKVSITANPEKCWNWQGGRYRRGYGRFCVTVSPNKDISFIASRVSYFIENKVDPFGEIVIHSCDNPSCVNPNHLSLGTFKDNTKDMMDKKRGSNQFSDGEDHSGSKLTEDIVRDIRSGKYAGFNQTQIARILNVDASCICNVLRFKNWKHVK